MFKVYWSSADGTAHGREIVDLSEALNFTQTLRVSDMRFVTVIAEDPNCTSLPGVRGMERQDYHWRKRRSR